MATVFRNFPYEKRAFLNPEDTTKRNPDFPELCVSTFSENIINEFVSAGDTEVIGQYIPPMELFRFIRSFTKTPRLPVSYQESARLHVSQASKKSLRWVQKNWCYLEAAAS